MRGSSARPKPPWLPGLLVLISATALGLLTGMALELQSWPPYVFLVILALLLIGALERILERNKHVLPPKAKSRLRLIRGGRNGFDLESDESHKDQKWLM